MFLIIGLGNPGKNYSNTRHNIGFVLIDKFLEHLIIQATYYRFNAEVFESSYLDKRLLLIKPLTYMNNSGIPIKRFVNQYQSEIEKMIVIHDDIDLELGTLKFKSNGGTGGHNGLESIVENLKSKDFDRLRIGIGRPPKKIDPATYVLSNFRRKELLIIKEILEIAVSALKDYIEFGIDYSMNKYNT